MKFSITALVIFTEEIHNEKLYFFMQCTLQRLRKYEMRCAIWYHLYISRFLDCTKLPNRATHHNKCSGIYKDVIETADLTTFLDWDEVGWPISCHLSPSTPPENIQKKSVFRYFQGV